MPPSSSSLEEKRIRQIYAHLEDSGDEVEAAIALETAALTLKLVSRHLSAVIRSRERTLGAWCEMTNEQKRWWNWVQNGLFRTNYLVADRVSILEQYCEIKRLLLFRVEELLVEIARIETEAVSTRNLFSYSAIPGVPPKALHMNSFANLKDHVSSATWRRAISDTYHLVRLALNLTFLPPVDVRVARGLRRHIARVLTRLHIWCPDSFANHVEDLTALPLFPFTQVSRTRAWCRVRNILFLRMPWSRASTAHFTIDDDALEEFCSPPRRKRREIKSGGDRQNETRGGGLALDHPSLAPSPVYTFRRFDPYSAIGEGDTDPSSAATDRVVPYTLGLDNYNSKSREEGEDDDAVDDNNKLAVYPVLQDGGLENDDCREDRIRHHMLIYENTALRVCALGLGGIFAIWGARRFLTSTSSFSLNAIRTSLSTAARSAMEWFAAHLAEPARMMAQELFSYKKPSQDNAVLAEDARQSLMAMLEDWRRDRGGEATVETISREYERAIRAPIREGLFGDLLRLALIQGQALKSQTLALAQVVDDMVAENRFNSQVLATLPAVGLLVVLRQAVNSARLWVRSEGARLVTARHARHTLGIMLWNLEYLLVVEDDGPSLFGLTLLEDQRFAETGSETFGVGGGGGGHPLPGSGSPPLTSSVFASGGGGGGAHRGGGAFNTPPAAHQQQSQHAHNHQFSSPLSSRRGSRTSLSRHRTGEESGDVTTRNGRRGNNEDGDEEEEVMEEDDEEEEEAFPGTGNDEDDWRCLSDPVVRHRRASAGHGIQIVNGLLDLIWEARANGSWSYYFDSLGECDLFVRDTAALLPRNGMSPGARWRIVHGLRQKYL